MKIVVTGGRLFDDKEMMYKVLGKIHNKTPIESLAHGDCTGADELAREWALDAGITAVGYPAAWNIGTNAGEKRNEYMLKNFQPDYVLAFPGGSGTADAVKFAKQKGYKVLFAEKIGED